MKPVDHGKASVKRHGGVPADYQDIHDFIDSTKICHPDMRHRALLHNSWGCYLVERIFGVERINSSGRAYSPRDIAEEHIIQDMGRIPIVSDYLNGMPLYEWLGGPKRTTKKMTLDGIEIVD